MNVVLFDIDGTLIDSRGAGHAAFYQTLQEEFAITTIDGEVTFSGRSDRAIAFDLFALHDIEATQENWLRFVAGFTTRLCTTLYEKRGHVLPGVFELLDTLVDRGDVPLGLLTGNVTLGAARKLEHFRLADYFAFGGYGDEHLSRDDIAHAAVKAARDAGVSANGMNFVVIGDTQHDITCARAIGATAIAVTTGATQRSVLADAQPDLLLDDLSDANPLLRLLD